MHSLAQQPIIKRSRDKHRPAVLGHHGKLAGLCISDELAGAGSKIAYSKGLHDIVPSNDGTICSKALDSISSGRMKRLADKILLDGVRESSSDACRALELILGHLDCDTGTIHRLGDDGMLHLDAWAGQIPEQLLPVIQTIPVGKGIAGLAVERAQPVDMCNLQTDTSGDARPGAKQTGARGSLCVPMMRDGKPVGALGVATASERRFNELETQILLEAGRILVE